MFIWMKGHLSKGEIINSDRSRTDLNGRHSKWLVWGLSRAPWWVWGKDPLKSPSSDKIRRIYFNGFGHNYCNTKWIIFVKGGGGCAWRRHWSRKSKKKIRWSHLKIFWTTGLKIVWKLPDIMKFSVCPCLVILMCKQTCTGSTYSSLFESWPPGIGWGHNKGAKFNMIIHLKILLQSFPQEQQRYD